MHITNRNTALEWLTSWGDKLRPGILNAAIYGVHACYGMAWIAGHDLEARGYAEAWSVLTAGRVIEPLHQGLR